MASLPDIDHPVYGYFVTSSVEEVIAYSLAVLRKFNKSCILILHSSALFKKDDEIQEFHLPILPTIILDPQMPDIIISEFVENQTDLSIDAELYENMEGSGWSLIPHTQRYWFKIHPCQPNTSAYENRDNISEYDQDENEDNERPRSPIKKVNHIAYAITEHYARKVSTKIPRQIELKRHFLLQFNETESKFFTEDEFYTPMSFSDLPEWHKEMNVFNIRVFSMRGNLLYAQMKNPTSDDIIDLYLNSKQQLAYIRNIYTLFKKKLTYHFCMKCYQWKSEKHTCEQKRIANKTEDVHMPDIPFGRAGLVGYADFESIINENGSHSISGWAAMFINKFHEVRSEKLENIQLHNSSSELIKSFINYLAEVSDNFAYDEGHETDECKICDLPIMKNSDVIIGRNFINGIQGSHHTDCWNHVKNSMYVMFHNFRGYDSHFLIKEIVENCEVLGLTATSMEKFNLISIKCPTNDLVRITFKDTYNFFTCSLAKCVSMIENWIYTPEQDRDSKGTFPYDWFNSYDKLNETSLPPGPWYNKLTNQIMDEKPALELWKKHNFKKFSEYHDYYMMVDVYQLADAFEEFRRTCTDEFNTDPVHFQGAPGLTWYLGLCQNPMLFKVIKDVDIYMDIQSSIRGGISQAMTKYINLENKPNESMFFLDVNSLYSKCMTYKMPGKFIKRAEKLPDNWKELFNENTHLCALMVVDLYYPDHLHDRDFAYPLAPHKYNDRLCTTFKRKEKYMLHAELLAFYLERGLILEKFHYMYIFEQDYCLRDYVQGNIEKRRNTRSEVMKTLYKLLNNSLYGKTCENVNKYRKFEVINDESDNDGDSFNSELTTCKNMIVCGNKLLIEKTPGEVILNKPIQIGFTILEFAKREIYKFLSICQDHFGDKVIPLYTDTDSILFWCDFPSPWREFYNSPLLPLLDFEKAPAAWNLKTHDTDKQSGLWSPEANGKQIVEYCGLRAKCYCYRFYDNEIVVKNKGIPKSAMISNEDERPAERISMEHYRNALFEGMNFKITHYAIRSLKHEVFSRREYKLGLTATDFKRALTTNRGFTLPFGYKGIKFKDIAIDTEDPHNLDS